MSAAFVLDSLLEASARATAVVALIGLTLAAFRVKTPAVRHAAWTGALVVMLALPVASGVLPTVPLPLWVPQVPLEVAATMPAAAVPAVLQSPRVAPGVIQVTASDSSRQFAANTSATIGLTTLPTRAVETSWTWRQWIVLVWLGIALVFVVRELVGALMARSLARSGVPVDGDACTFASPRIVTPVVVGVLAPRVMVPLSWSKWGAGVREMVLLHERAHVGRRDPLFACLARLNRAVFWFHPLAWWLHRNLSRTAEQACDEVVVRTMPDRRLYAALLVEMAKRLHHNKVRVAWQGTGVVDGHRFEDRVDRVLSGAAPQLSRQKRTALAIVSTCLISIAVACGTAAAPLAEDPELAKKITAAVAGFANYEAVKTMNLDQAAELERMVARNPDDETATDKLLLFYMMHGHKLMEWNQLVAARRPHLLRVIERRPGVSRWPISRRLDSEGYEKARTLWLTHVERPDASLAVLSQGASFFERVEKPLAEQLLLRAQAMDPKGPTPRATVTGVSRLSWSERLGQLYAMAIAGSHDLTGWDDVTTVDAEQLKSEFAKHARQKLDHSDDPVLLLGAGNFLVYSAANAKLDFDPAALGREYVAKSLKLDPTSVEAKRILTQPAFNFEEFMKNRSAKIEAMRQRFGKPLNELDDAAFEQLAAATKLEYAQVLLWSPYSQAMDSYRKKDEKGVEAAFASLKGRADAFQKLVDSPSSSVPAGLQFDLHFAFGTWAMHQGNSREANRRLGLALSVASAGFATERVGLSSAADKLAYDLLDAGERESVAAFYEGIASRLGAEAKATCEQAARAIREGRMPHDYQRYRAGLE